MTTEWFVARMEELAGVDRLCLGEVVDGQVVCPLHRWKFRLDSGDTAMAPRMKATCYPVTVHDGEIRVILPQRDQARGAAAPGPQTPRNARRAAPLMGAIIRRLSAHCRPRSA